MECRLNGTSKLLDHCKTDNSDSAHISKLIIEDIDILKYESKDFSEIEKKISIIRKVLAQSCHKK